MVTKPGESPKDKAARRHELALKAARMREDGNGKANHHDDPHSHAGELLQQVKVREEQLAGKLRDSGLLETLFRKIEVKKNAGGVVAQFSIAGTADNALDTIPGMSELVALVGARPQFRSADSTYIFTKPEKLIASLERAGFKITGQLATHREEIMAAAKAPGATRA